MRNAKLSTILAVALVILMSQGNTTYAESMGTAFTYQGRLIDAEEAADGLYDFQFKLYDNAEDGNQLNGDVNIPNLEVIEGYFTAELDFGSDVFNGEARWLEIGVRPGEPEDVNAYTVLEPRQEVTPAPYALYADKTGALETSGDLVLTSESGNVDIGSADNSTITHFFTEPGGGWRMYHSPEPGGMSILGVYPVDFVGASYGTPSELEWDFDDGETNTTIMTLYTSEGSGNNIALCPDGLDVLVGAPSKSVDTHFFGEQRIYSTSGGDGGAGILGVYPVDFVGASYGASSELEWDFGDDETDKMSVHYTSEASGSNMAIVSAGGKLIVGALDKETDMSVYGQVKITGGSPGAGKVLTSDADGLATWENIASGADDDWAWSSGSGLTGDIYHTGNVGIGTTSPGAKLKVSSNTSTLFNLQNSSLDVDERAWDFRVENVGNKGELRIRAVTDSGVTETHALSIQRDGDFIVSSGNVGIGTTVPDKLLTVDGVVVNDYVARFQNGNTGTGQNYGVYIKAGSSGSDRALRIENTSSDTILSVDGAGKVGIGTNSASAYLSIDPTRTGSGVVGTHYGAKNHATIGAGTQIITYYGSYIAAPTISGGSISGSKYALVTEADAGDVGIGTTSPARKLHVNDVIRLEPRSDFPAGGSDGDLCVVGDPNDRHIYCYLNDDWRQLD